MTSAPVSVGCVRRRAHERTFIALGLALGLLGGCASTECCTTSGTCTTADRPAAHADDGVFVHIRSGPDDAHSVLMGLRMAQLMSEDHDALVYIDVHGINAVVKDAPDMSMEPFGSSRAMLADLLDRGVGVYACPGCLKALGKTPADLLPGIQVANKAAFFGFTDGRIITLDY